LQNGDLKLKGKTFSFRDQQCSARDVNRLFTQVDKELDAELQAFHRLDRQVFLAHWSLARHLDHATGQGNSGELDLLERYRFHMALQGLLQGMLGEQARLQTVLDLLSRNSPLQEADFNEVKNALHEIHQTLTCNLEDSKKFRTPSLTNVPAGSSLYALIVDRGDTTLPALSGTSITGEWLGKLMSRLDGVLSRLKRLHFKSLGSLLACQEKMVSAWKATADEKGEQVPASIATAGEAENHS